MADIFIEIGMAEGSDVPAAYRLRDAIHRELLILGENVQPVGGGTQFEPLVADEHFEADDLTRALSVVGIAAYVLLRNGYKIDSANEKLIVHERTRPDRPPYDGDPAPGVAYVEIVTPLGVS